MSVRVEDRYETVSDLQKDILAYRNGFMTEAENASFFKGVKLLFLRHKLVGYLSIFLIFLCTLLVSFLVRNLKLTQENAQQLEEKLKLEKDYHEKINKDSAPLFFNNANFAYKTANIKDALNFSSTAVELDPSILEAWDIKAKCHFIMEEFNQASQAFKRARKGTDFLKISDKYLRLKNDDRSKLPIINYTDIMKQVKAEIGTDVYGKMLQFKAYTNMPLSDRIIYVREVLEMHNNRNGEEFNFTFDETTGHLDLSNNPWLKTILCLQNFPAISLDLSNTSITNLIGLRNIPLKELNISKTKVVELHTLENLTLKDLNIAHTGIPNFSPIKHFDLEIVDISHSGMIGVNGIIKSFQNVKEITVHKGQFEEKFLKVVPENVKLKIVD